MHKKIIAFILFFTIVFSSTCTFAKGEEIQKLDTVEVTGSRIVESFAEVPAQTYIITKEDITNSGAKTVNDALKYIPGLLTTVNDASMAQKKGLTLRGLTSEMLYLIDGIAVSDPNHGTGSDLGGPLDLRTIDLDTVERIEVLKGSSSAIYGSDAAGGVINIITKKSFDKPHASTSLFAGSNGYFSTSTRAGVAEDAWRVTLGYRYTREGQTRIRKSEDGTYDHANHYSSNDYNFSIGYKNWKFVGFAGQNKSNWESSQFGFQQYDQKNTYGRYTLQYDDGKFLGRFFIHKLESITAARDNSENSDTSSTTYGGTLTRKTKFGIVPFSYGIDYKEDKTTYTDKTGFSYPYNKSRFEVAPYIETSLPIGVCAFDIGLRYEYWNISDGANYKELMPRFSFNFANEQGTTYYLTIARHFSMPTLYQMFGESAYLSINPDLKAEKGWDYEIGIKNAESKNPWSAGIFYINLDDKINYVTTDPSSWKGQYRNVDKYRAWGFEANYQWNWHENWSLTPAISFTKGEEKYASSRWVRSGEPRWKASLILGFKKNGWTASLNGLFYADRTFGEDNYYKYDSGNIFTMDFSLAKKIKDLTLQFAVTNLFNKEYFTSKDGYLNPERRFMFKATYDL